MIEAGLTVKEVSRGGDNNLHSLLIFVIKKDYKHNPSWD